MEQLSKEKVMEEFLFTEKYINMSENERARIINTGMFNSFIEAYMKLTLKELGRSKAEIQQATVVLKDILDSITAMEARKKAGE